MIRTGIVCGCLPAQAGIEQDELYHQLLAASMLEQTGKQLDISSIWYTTLSGCRNHVLELISKKNPEIILYHVRPDPYLRVSKLLIRFRNHANRFRLLLNLHADDTKLDERSYSPKGSLPTRKKSLLKIFFMDMNYIAGLMFRINNRAILKEKKLLNEILTICMQHEKQLLLVGPASRPRSVMENYLLKRLEHRLSREFINENGRYITCFGIRGSENENLFMEDGVHVSKAGHRRMAALIAPVLKEIILNKSGKDK